MQWSSSPTVSLQFCSMPIVFCWNCKLSVSHSFFDREPPSAIYLALDAVIIVCVMWLFLDPVIKLMGDLRTKSVDLIELQTSSRRLTAPQSSSGSESPSASPEPPTATAHSPTPVGGAVYRYPERTTAATPTEPGPGVSATDVTSAEHTEALSVFKKMKRLPVCCSLF